MQWVICINIAGISEAIKKHCFISSNKVNRLVAMANSQQLLVKLAK